MPPVPRAVVTPLAAPPTAPATPAARAVGGSVGAGGPAEAGAGAPGTRPEEHVRRILVADDFPAFSRQMGDLMASLHEGEASAQRLANMVLRDYALTVKVIRTANTLHYNRTGRPVQSATHAMMLLGARTVRDLASSLLLFEQYRHRSSGLKELMLLSLLTANAAREAAARLGVADPETAQLCGMFRNLGEVLAAAHLRREYSGILRASVERRGRGSARRAREAAAVEVLGCSLEDIGVAIAGDWGMPDAVCRGMRATGEKGEDLTALVTAFAHDLTAAIYREEEGPARVAIGTVLERYGARLKVTRDVLAAIADGAVAATRETFAAAGVALDDLRLTRQVASALSERPAPEVPAAGASRSEGEPDAGGGAEAAAAPVTPAGTAATVPAGAAGATDGAAAAIATPAVGVPALTAASAAADGRSGPERVDAATEAVHLAALRDRLARELEDAADDLGTYDVQRALLLALEAALRGGPFDRACFCPIDVGRGAFRARFGLGDGVDALVESLAVPFAGGASAIGTTLLRGEELHLAQGTRLELAEAQLLRGAGAASLALLPVGLEGTTIGAIYLDRRGAGGALDATTLVYVRRVVAGAARALARRRGHPATTSPQRGAAPGGATAAGPGSSTTASAIAATDARPPELSAAAKGELVLRVLRGQPLDAVAASAGVPPASLDAWRREFLDGAMARLAG